MNKTSLYLVPTPIGNLRDITYRAVDILKEVDEILAEDTRTSSIIMKTYGIATPMKSFHIHNEHNKTNALVADMTNGKTLALVSDSGTPSISDPGYLLVRSCLAANLAIECLPGATAMIPAMVKSGFPTDQFVFQGFLPHKKGKTKRIQQIATEKRTTICYESPHRLLKTLLQMSELFEEDRLVSISRELTKKFEETRTTTIKKHIKHFTTTPPKGEFVIVVQPIKKI